MPLKIEDAAATHAPLTSASIETGTAAIYQLTIERYRGIQALSWRPGRGANGWVNSAAPRSS